MYDVLVTHNEDGKHADLSNYTATEIDQLIAYLKQIDETNDDDVVTSIATDVIDNKTTVLAYPNPAQDRVNITINHIDNPSGTLAIYDQRGVKRSSPITMGGASTIQIDIINYPSGVYIIKYSDNKDVMQTKLIIP